MLYLAIRLPGRRPRRGRLGGKRFPHLNGRVVINSVGTTIGSHTGPGTVALFFWGDERTA